MRLEISSSLTLKGRVRGRKQVGPMPQKMDSINQTLPRDLDSQVGLGEHGAALYFQESRICQPCRGKEAQTGAAGEMEATPRRSLTCFWHKLFISSTLYYTRMMFP